jgi:hypothetical protein
MRRKAAVVFLIVLAAQSSALAQTPAAPQAPSETAAATMPQMDAQPSNRAPRDASGDADARHCLDLASNSEVIACAEKYRSHRSKK